MILPVAFPGDAAHTARTFGQEVPVGIAVYFRVPGNSILMQSGLAIIFVVSGTFDQIITLLSFSLGIFPILAVLGVFKLRMKKKSVLKMPGYPYFPLIFILLSIIILVLAYLERPVESSIALGVILVGIPVYYLLKRAHEKRN